METTPEKYQAYVRQKQKKSPLGKDMALAFLIGGLICVLGQLILDGYIAAGLPREEAATATSVSLVFLSALLTGLNLYHRLARYGGAGTLVPITGFANAVVSPAIDFKAEGFVTGMAAKMFLVAGPVIDPGGPFPYPHLHRRHRGPAVYLHLQRRVYLLPAGGDHTPFDLFGVPEKAGAADAAVPGSLHGGPWAADPGE